MYRLVTQRLVTYRLASVANQLRRVLSLIHYNIALRYYYYLYVPRKDEEDKEDEEDRDEHKDSNRYKR